MADQGLRGGPGTGDGRGGPGSQDRLRAELAQTRARLVDEVKSNAQLRDELRHMELRALQSQINPHFLFNTLAAINSQAVLESAGATSELILALSRLLRYNLRRLKDVVPLRDELAAVRDYLFIQQARSDGVMRVSIAVDQELMETPVPLLSVQPLVENAVLHGLENRPDGQLQVVGRRRGDVAEIEVTDNGQGMSAERLREVLEQKDSGSGLAHTTGLGLYSVDRRLKYYFGPEFGLQLVSRPGSGTRVTLRLPYTTIFRGGGA